MSVSIPKSALGHFTSVQQSRAYDLAGHIECEIENLSAHVLDLDNTYQDRNHEAGVVLLDRAYWAPERPPGHDNGEGYSLGSLTGLTRFSQGKAQEMDLTYRSSERIRNWDDELSEVTTQHLAKVHDSDKERVMETEQGIVRLNKATGTLTVEAHHEAEKSERRWLPDWNR